MNSDTRDADEAMLTLENTDDWLVVNDGVMGGVNMTIEHAKANAGLC